MKKIKKAVFPVAGLGTRFLPATKANPKEMLSVVDKPLIQYAVEEAVNAGLTELVFITGRNKRSIEDHFDKAYELETELSYKNKVELLEHVQKIIPDNVTCIYIRQTEALGLGHAVLCAQAAIDNEPFAVILADDLIDAPKGVMTQMVELYQQTGSNIIAATEIPLEDTPSYGIIDIYTDVVSGLSRVRSIVEKPQPQDAPSNLGVVGRYILNPAIFHLLRTTPRGAGGEIQLTDAIAASLQHETLLACRFEGTRYDCGSKLGYLHANLVYGLNHPHVGPEFKEIVRQIAAELDA